MPPARVASAPGKTTRSCLQLKSSVALQASFFFPFPSPTSEIPLSRGQLESGIPDYKMRFDKCPSTEEWIKKMWYIYTQGNITQPLIMPSAAPRMGLEIVIPSKVSQTEEEKCGMTRLKCGI